jgi:hypothetical protein
MGWQLHAAAAPRAAAAARPPGPTSAAAGWATEDALWLFGGVTRRFGRIVAPEIEAPILLVDMVCSGRTVSRIENAAEP